MTEKTEFQPPLSTMGVGAMNAARLDELRFETRRRAAWNRRAALLRALQHNPSEEQRASTEQMVRDLERAFQNAQWEIDGDATARLDPVTPLPSVAEVAALAEANNAAAQRVAIVANVTGWIELAETFLNIANGRIPAQAQADQADEAAISAIDHRQPAPRPKGANGMMIGAVIVGVLLVGLIAAALMKGN